MLTSKTVHLKIITSYESIINYGEGEGGTPSLDVRFSHTEREGGGGAKSVHPFNGGEGGWAQQLRPSCCFYNILTSLARNKQRSCAPSWSLLFVLVQEG